MRYVKLLSAAVPVALMAAVVLGSAPASAATVLCSAPETTCAKANTYPAETGLGGWIFSSEQSFEIKSFGVPYKCGSAILGATSTAEAGSPLPGQGETQIASCTFEGKSCSSASSSQPPATFVPTGGGGGTVKLGTAEKHMTFTLVCAQGLQCTYGTSELQLQDVVGVEEHVLKANEVALTKESPSSALCPKSAKLNTVLTPVSGPEKYISSQYTVLCSAMEFPCAGGHVMAAGSLLSGEVGAIGGTSFTVTPSGALGAPFSCSSASIGGSSTAETGNPLQLNGENKISGCTIVGSGVPCKTATATSPTATLTATADQNGTLTVGTSEKRLSFAFAECMLGLKCTFGAAAVPFSVDNGDEAVVAKDLILTREAGSESACGNTAKLNVVASLTGPSGYASAY